MTQKWIIFEADAKQTQIDWWLSRNKDVVGYFLGVPVALQGQAEAEGWTLPYIWEEQVA